LLPLAIDLGSALAKLYLSINEFPFLDSLSSPINESAMSSDIFSGVSLL
jgi:hypothetical protein